MRALGETTNLDATKAITAYLVVQPDTYSSNVPAGSTRNSPEALRLSHEELSATRM